MGATDTKPSKKRRQSEDPEAAAKRRQKKQKKTPLSAEIITSDVESAPPSPSLAANGKSQGSKAEDGAKAKKDKAKKAAAAGISASQQSILDPIEVSLTPPPDTQDKKKSKKKKKRDTEEELGATNGASTGHVEDESSTKVKKEKKDKKKKKKHDDADVADADEKKTKKEKKDKKKKKKDRDADADEDTLNAKREASVDLGSQAPPAAQNGADVSSIPRLPTTTPEKKRRRKDKSLEIQATPPPESPKAAASTTAHRFSTPSVQADARAETASFTKTYASADADSEPSGPPPVINQEVARWIPLWPRGWDQPITAAIEQHLTPKLHRYDGEIGGVLLSFKNVSLNDKPTREGAATTDEESVKLLSVNEYGVGYCWLIADLELFMPKRGAWMEGELILQNQGHVGVVCWGKFNASIEAKRLPPKWYWVAAPEDDGDVNMDMNGDGDGGEEHPSATVLGHWVDEAGNKINGNLRFRIKNYDVGLSGDHSYLCIEGTMLSENEENRLRERELKRANLGSTVGSLRRRQRALPEFSMTDLGVDADAEKKKKSDWGVRTPKKRERREPREQVEQGEQSSEGGAEPMNVDVEEDEE